MLDLIVGFVLDALIAGFLWGTGAVLLKIVTLNRCNPRHLAQTTVAILGLVFWTVVVLVACGQLV
jgi:hypothetical protein